MSSHGSAGNNPNKDLSMAKHLRDRRRRETRTTTPPPAGSAYLLPSTSTDSPQVPASMTRTEGHPTTTRSSSRPAADNQHQDLLNQSYELSEQASAALRMAQRGAKPTTAEAVSSLASRRLPTTATTTTTTFRRPTAAPPRATTAQQRPVPPTTTAPAAPVSTRTTTPLQTADNRAPTTATAATTATKTLPAVQERRQRATRAEQGEPEEILTLDATLPQLRRQPPFSLLTRHHPLGITSGTAVRLRMTVHDKTCPAVLGCIHKDNHIVQACSAPAVCSDFVVQDIQWPYDGVLCYGDAVAFCKQTSSVEETAEYLQVTAATHRDATVANTSMWDVTVGPAGQDVWHVWTVLPYMPSLPVRLGYAATTTTTRVRSSSGVPVRGTAPVLLRHVKTGGILSLDGGGVLTLRTDVLTSPGNIVANAATMDRLQRHDLLLPSRREAVWFESNTVPLTLPVWQFQDSRLFLQGDYLSQTDRHGTAGVTKSPTPIQNSFMQAKALVDELLGSFVGLEGNLVHYTAEGSFVVSGCDANLSKLATDLASLSNDFVTVRRFVAAQYPGYPFGRVRQALGAALDVCLQEYLQHISSIESRYHQEGDDFGLQKLAVLVQSSRDCLAILRQVTFVAEHQTGGAMLNALRKLQVESYHGDALGHQLLNRLLGEASRPYLTMLQQWMVDGTLDDTHGEFMVQKSESAGEVWEDCFVVRPEHVLEGFFSTSQTRDEVLPTGRYWQAIQSFRSARKKTAATTDFTLTYHANPAQVSAYVHQQYLAASRDLSKLLLVDYDLLGTLKLIKRYYLLDQGDFFVNFMDAAEEDLYVAREKISVGRLQHWLGLSVQLTEHKSDEAWVASPSRAPQELKPSANELRCRLADYGLIDRLDRLHRETGGIDTSNPGTPQRRIYSSGEDGQTGVDIFCIELPRIPSPLNLILSPKDMNDYQLLFRSLFFAKHVERRLVSVWRDHLTLKELPSLRGSMGRTFLLRQRMLHCLQHLIYYMMFEVIEPNWTELEKKITGGSTDSKEQTVDDILMLHSRFLERTLEACLITSRELLSSLMRLMRTCLLFADQMKLFMKSIGINQDLHKLALEKQKVVQQGLHNWDTSRRNNQKELHKTLRKDYLDRQQRVLEHTRRVEREVTLSSYTAMIDRHEEVFNLQLREFMNLLSKSDDLYHTQKVNLCISLDYNGFAGTTTA